MCVHVCVHVCGGVGVGGGVYVCVCVIKLSVLLLHYCMPSTMLDNTKSL